MRRQIKHDAPPMGSRGMGSSSSSESSGEPVDDIGSVMDSMMDAEDKDRPKKGTRVAAHAMIVILFLSALTYLFVDYYKKREEKIEKQEMPRIAHAVQEFQGWRRLNYIGLMIMMLTGAAVIMSVGYYRRVRAEKARRHDSVFWFLSGSSILSGFLFILYRIRERKRSAVRKAMKYAARHPSHVKQYLAAAVLGSLVFGLLYYRRRMHALHVAKKKAKAAKQRDQEVQVISAQPQAPPGAPDAR